MMELLFETGISNSIVAAALALIAFVVGKTTQQSRLSHFLWILVFVKLITPPLFVIPVEMPVASGEAIPVLNSIEAPLGFETQSQPYVPDDLAEATLLPEPAVVPVSARIYEQIPLFLGAVWLLGIFGIAITSAFRVFRFESLLRQNLRPASGGIHQLSRELCQELTISAPPTIYTTTAQLCPMVWWTGGEIKVILPQSMQSQMSTEQIRWVLAHELAHVKRKDYLVRWLEWFTRTVFWWNPVVWIAQRELRVVEEILCDQLVMTRLNPNAKTYAESIVSAIEALVCPAIRPPAMASEINSGGFLERRIDMILSESPKLKPWQRLQSLIAMVAILFVPLGFVQAQDVEAVQKRLMKAVKNDELSLEQAAMMMDVLRESMHEQHEDEWHERREHEEREHHERMMREGEHQERDREEAFRRAVIEIEHAVEAGNLSEEKAHKKIMHIKHELWPDDDKDLEHEQHERAERERALAHRDEMEMYEQAVMEVKMAIEHGRISREAGEERLQDLKMRLWRHMQRVDNEHDHDYEEHEHDDHEHHADEAHDHDDDHSEVREHQRKMEQRRRRAEMAMVEIEKMVESGKISSEEAREKMEGLRRAMEHSHEKDDGSDAKVKRFKQAQEELTKLVKAGKISKEQAEERLISMKQKMWPGKVQEAELKQKRDAEREEHFKKAVVEVESAIKAGKISKEEGHERLMGLKKRLWPEEFEDEEEEVEEDQPRRRRSRDRGADRKEEMEERRERSRDREREEARDGEERSDRQWQAVRERLEIAVEEGRMSREDADRNYLLLMDRIQRSRDDNDDE